MSWFRRKLLPAGTAAKGTATDEAPAPKGYEPVSEADVLQHPALRAFAVGPIDSRDDWFEAFLAQDELDDLRTRHDWRELTPEQTARVRAIVASGQPRQALFNLLLWPQLLPPDVGGRTIVDAIRQDREPYMRVAAIVGLQHFPAGSIPRESWPGVRDALLSAFPDRRMSIANRASVTLHTQARPGDGPSILAAARAAELAGGDLRNVFITLIRIGAHEEILQLLPDVLANEKLQPAARAWLERWKSLGRRPAEDPPASFGLPVLGYIPNLDEDGPPT